MEGRDPVTKARVMAVVVLTVEFAILGLTGLWLVFFYRPTADSGSISGLGMHGTGLVRAVRAVHRGTAVVCLPTAIASAVLVVVDARARRPDWRQGRLALVAGPGLAVVVVAATFTGYLLPWDQLALWAVTVGTDMHGYRQVFGSQVRFVLLDGTEIGPATLWRWFVLHTVALSLVAVAGLAVAWHPRRRADQHT